MYLRISTYSDYDFVSPQLITFTASYHHNWSFLQLHITTNDHSYTFISPQLIILTPSYHHNWSFLQLHITTIDHSYSFILHHTVIIASFHHACYLQFYITIYIVNFKSSRKIIVASFHYIPTIIDRNTVVGTDIGPVAFIHPISHCDWILLR